MCCMQWWRHGICKQIPIWPVYSYWVRRETVELGMHLAVLELSASYFILSIHQDIYCGPPGICTELNTTYVSVLHDHGHACNFYAPCTAYMNELVSLAPDSPAHSMFVILQGSYVQGNILPLTQLRFANVYSKRLSKVQRHCCATFLARLEVMFLLICARIVGVTWQCNHS